jgi:hypothetical protein
MRCGWGIPKKKLPSHITLDPSPGNPSGASRHLAHAPHPQPLSQETPPALRATSPKNRGGKQKKLVNRNNGFGKGVGKRRAGHGAIHLTPSDCPVEKGALER